MSTEHMEELNDQQIVRRKMTALREQGIDPLGNVLNVLLTLKSKRQICRTLIKNNYTN